MADYQKQTWTDEVPNTTPVQYKITKTTDGDIAPAATIELVTPVTAGTPVDATHPNHIEDGIFAAQQTANSASTAAATADTDALNAKGDAATAQSTANTALALATYPQVSLFSQYLSTPYTTTSTTYADTTLTTTITLSKNSRLIIWGTLDFYCAVAGSKCKLLVNGYYIGEIALPQTANSIHEQTPLLMLSSQLGAGAVTITVQLETGMASYAATINSGYLVILAIPVG